MQKQLLFIDIETFSSEPIAAGAFRYSEVKDFQIILISYAVGWAGEIKAFNPLNGYPEEFTQLFNDSSQYLKVAHNATFERVCFNRAGFKSTAADWLDTMFISAYNGYPLKLDTWCKALDMGEGKAKLATGKALIKFFCVPQKPTKIKPEPFRNYPAQDPEKWEEFVEYCKRDVGAMRAALALMDYKPTKAESKLYNLDSEINERGIKIDVRLAEQAESHYSKYKQEIYNKVQMLTGLENPNSPKQLKDWLSDQLGTQVESIEKSKMQPLIEESGNPLVTEVLKLRGLMSKTSIAKYNKVQTLVSTDSRVRGQFQFYGGNRTGRWAGRGIQPQNLPQNRIHSLEWARHVALNYEYDNAKQLIELMYGKDKFADVLSQLIRTMLIPSEGKVFAVADYSAIEARVLAWLAGETWVLEVFKTHGKIYEAAAANMFGVPLESVTKDSDYRKKGKVATLALGYGGSVGAMVALGAEKMGLSESEMLDIRDKWRGSNQEIVKFWRLLNKAAIAAIKYGTKTKVGLLTFECKNRTLTIKLPSSRVLVYQNSRVTRKSVVPPSGAPFTTDSITYKDVTQNHQWADVDTWGGKLAENVTQAVARDLLADYLMRLEKEGANIPGHMLVMHVHDESVSEVDAKGAKESLRTIEAIMCNGPKWAEGLPLAADGYVTEFYKKD